MQVIVHGGASEQPVNPERRQQVLDEAAASGADKTTPTEAVVSAVSVLESNPRFNAGVGSALQSDGTPRTDAGLMTDAREVGAACSMPGVCHAIEVARLVMDKTPHVLITGENAVSLAEGFGVETDRDLTTGWTRERWDELGVPDGYVCEHLGWVRERFGGTDTVGAVAVDGGQIAVATSTGGRWCALAGRVGDVPQIGSGFYASSAGGASATGAGEDIARVTLSRRAVANLEDGIEPQQAAESAIDEFASLTGSTAGIIVLDDTGRAGSAFNSQAMQTSIERS